VKNLSGFKGEILRCAQNDKNSLLIAPWYHNRHHELSLGFGGISPVLGYGVSIKGVWGCDTELQSKSNYW